ncbi:glycogen branching enzyme [Streptomyces lividans TK24]|nr:glycogen branching enzyme [Streptomyces lividans TK24]
MPKTAPLRTRRGQLAEPMSSLGELLRQWLPRQRWFAGKDRPVAELGLLSMTELFPGCLHLLVHTGQGSVPSPGGAPPAGDCYQLLLGVREQPSPRLGRAIIGQVQDGPLAGRTVYDALHDPRTAQLLLERFRHPGKAGPLRFEADPARPVPGGLAPRLLDAEQSNSSLIYGDEFIPEAVPPHPARRQPRPGGAGRAGPAGLRPGTGARGLDAHDPSVRGDPRRAPALPARRLRRLDPLPERAGRRGRVHRAGPRAGAGDG